MYDFAEPSFNEDAALGWWRKPYQVVEENEKPLVFPEIVEAIPVPAKVPFPDAADALDLNPTPPASPDPASPALALDDVLSPRRRHQHHHLHLLPHPSLLS